MTELLAGCEAVCHQAAMVGLGVDFAEPAEVVDVYDGLTQNIAGFHMAIRHAPGHTEGSVVFETVHDGQPTLFSGDVLFAGAIGRTDMPSGSMKDMKETLKKKILPLPNELIVLPGHGPQTTIARERQKNPYLQSDFLES